MKTDRYVKTLLTVIVLLLAFVAAHLLTQPGTVQAQSGFGNIAFSGPPEGFSFFDKSTGEIWSYGTNGAVVLHLKMTKLGKPLEQ